ncbi:MAG: hypothetical protein ABF968_10000 [Acetobacter sp.]|uniref:hypothetical protein n=1 Tax=Acetobacter sp. TaxID=440 RepID=UPI0039ED1AAF
MARMTQFASRYGRLEQGETNLSQRVEILRALADLRVIAAELKENRLFFDASSPYLDPVFS